MEDSRGQFEAICERLAGERHSVSRGKMMSSPGLKYRDRVFAFYYQDKMVFKLGEGFDIEEFGIRDYGLLSPFRTKPPLKAWFEIPASESRFWEPLAERALAFVAGE